MSLPYKGDMIPRAKKLRKQLTKQEKHLWYDFLRGYPVRFQRQKTIGCFVADFYCHKASLIVELDGGQHYSQNGAAYDAERSGVLAKFGLVVLRFSNFAVDYSFDAVCGEIARKVEERMVELDKIMKS